MKIPMKLLAIGAGAILSAAVAGPALAADHGDAPLAKANAALDINDVYAFDGEGDNVVFAMTVNPLTMPGDTPEFATDGLYQLNIDNDGDAVADVTYNVTFSGSGGSQEVTLKKATGGDAGNLSDAGDTVATGGTDDVIEEGDVKLFAGLRDDPFFFDLNAFRAGLAFRNPGNNFFAGLNVSAIVIEVPASDFLASGSTNASVWGVTSRGGEVIDRMGRPAINTVFIPEAQKDAFNQTTPDQDVAMWKDTVVAALESLGSDPALADALLPDVLAFDAAMPLNFLNGRALADDVIDAELQLITGNPAASDNVANDSTFLTEFPYLGVPNTSPAPTPVPVETPAGQPSPSAPTPVATAPGGIVAPDTGSGDAGGTGNAMLWVALGVVAGASILAAGVLARKSRNEAR
jgi:hypothetical protein